MKIVDHIVLDLWTDVAVEEVRVLYWEDMPDSLGYASAEFRLAWAKMKYEIVVAICGWFWKEYRK